MSLQPTWLQDYAASNAPGPGTDLKQKRLRLMQEIMPELNAWFKRHGFQAFEHRFKPSAYIGCTTMSDVPGAQLMARYTGWLFALDTCTDESPSLEDLEKRTRQLVVPFIGKPGTPAPAGTGAPGLAQHLAESFEELRQEMERLRGPILDAASLGFCLSTYAAETAAVVRAMSWERLQTLRYIESGKRASPITMEDYLRVGHYSICVRAAASLALAYEKEPMLMWSHWQQAMYAGAGVLRLVNDLSNIQREFEEGKLNAITITLHNNGWDGKKIPEPKSPELARAVASVQKQLDVELQQFTTEMRKLYKEGIVRIDVDAADKQQDGQDMVDPSPVCTNVVAGVAFSIAMYKRGDYLVPTREDLS